VSSIDQRVVQMVFDNSAFEKGIATTLSSLDKLTNSLKMTGATKGLDDIDEAASKGLSLSGIASGIDSISSKFSALGVIGVTALANITNKVIDAGIEMAKNFVIDPIKDGLNDYQEQIQATQTILANTASAGTTLSQVTGVLKQLQTYANQTVYSFSNMATSIGAFTAAGVDLNTSVSAIKGIANLAAMDGATSDQATSAMYQLSQAIAAGQVKLQDWNSVVNAGLGGKTLQTALVNTARASGVAIDSIIKKAGSFRNSLQSGWLTSQILTKTLAQFTGDLSVAQIKAMGYTEAQAEAIYKQSMVAVDAATKIKTLNQLTEALKEEVATAYGSIFKTIFGNIDQATTLFTGIHNAAENALTGPIYALNALLQGWSDLGGRATLITALTYVMDDLGQVVGVVASAFRSVFPPTTAEELVGLTNGFLRLVESFKMGATTQYELQRTFAGLFSVVSIVIFVIKQLGGQLLALLGYATQSSSGFLGLTAKAGDFLVKLKNLIETSDGVTEFFGILGKSLALPINLIQLLVGYVVDLVDKLEGITSSHASDALKNMTVQMGPLGELIKLAGDGWQYFQDHLSGIEKFIQPLMVKFDTFFAHLASSIATAVGSLNFQDVVNVINTGLFATVTLLLKKFVDHFTSGSGGLGGIVDTIKESFEALNETFETMQKTLKAATLLEIALAVAALTISVIALSRIDTQGLLRASSAITVMFTQLMGSLLIFEKFVEGEGWAKMPVMMASLILLAAAIDILVIAVTELSKLSWDGLSKGLTGISVMMAELLVMIKLMGDPEGLIASGLGLTAFAKGVKVLADAVIILSGLSWDQMAKGLVGVGVLLGSLGLFEKFAGTEASGILSGAGIILLATGIKILASTIGTFAKYSWESIGKGLASMAGGLGLIGAALYLIPPSSVISAAAVLIVASSLGLIGDAISKMGSNSWATIGRGLTELAGALTLISVALLFMEEALPGAAALVVSSVALGMIANALGKMGEMPWDSIAKSLVELTGALALIAAALILMELSLPGSAALLVAAAALEVLLPVLTTMGNMSWASLGEAMAGLAGVFVIFAAAGILLTPLAPTLLALGAAILLMGIGIAAAGAGVFLFATGLTALAVAGTAAAAALTAIVSAMLGLLPKVGKEIGLAVIAFATTIATAGPAIVNAITTVLTALLTAVDKMSPRFNTTFGNILVLFLQDIDKYSPQINATFLRLMSLLLSDIVGYIPKLTNAGVDILIAVINGIASRTGSLVSAATNVVIAFINGIGSNSLRVTQAGINMIINFINGLANQIRAATPQMDAAGANLGEAIINGMTGGLASKAAELLNEAESIAGSVLKALGKVLDAHSPSREAFKLGAWTTEGFNNGLGSMGDAVKDSATDVGKTALTAMSKTIVGMSDLISGSMDVAPTITPVLDLSNVKKNASQISDLLATTPVNVGASTTSAKIASAGYSDNTNAITQVANTPKTPPPVNYTQNNYSPKALSPVEIYRQTKNQLSTTRGVLVYQDGGDEQSG
jgi:tape measure domain-containing protein